MTPRLVVVGSANMDLVVKADRIPVPGETVIGGEFVTAPGGKGANQAVAAARLGADVWFVGRVGRDPFGDALVAEMQAAGIHTEFVRRDEHQPTGVALIGVDRLGQNAIIVAPGANHRVNRHDIESAQDVIASAYAVVIQLEIPPDAVEAAIAIAAASGTRVILNPAPVRPDGALSDSLVSKVDVLTPNEHEATQLLGCSVPYPSSWETAAQALRAKGVSTVVITLGKAGCLLADESGVRRIPAMRVETVDTTAAGDCFTGALAVGLAESKSLDDAALFASKAAALSVTRLGAQTSLPTRQEVESFETQDPDR